MGYMTKEEFIAKVENHEELAPHEVAGLWWGEYKWAEDYDYIRGEDGRWSHYDEKVIKVDGRFFIIGCDIGLTEYREDEFCTEVIEACRETNYYY